MFYIYSNDLPELAKENPVHTFDVKGTLEMMLEDHKASELVVCTNEYLEAKIALESQVKLVFKGTLIKPSEVKTMLAKALFLFSCASNSTDVLDSQDNLKRAVMASVPSQMTEAKAISVIEALCDIPAKRDVLQRIAKAFNDRREHVRSKISFDKKGLNVVEANYTDGSTRDFILSNEGIHILSGEKGTGKSELMIEVFKSNVSSHKYPIFVNSSRALAESMVTSDIEPLFYRNILANRDARGQVDVRKGILGVVNTVLMNGDLKSQRTASRTFIVDEIEEVLNHMSGKAVGKGKLEDQAFIFEQFESQLNKSKTVIITDAMMSQDTLDLIKRMNKNGKAIYVHGQKSRFQKPVIRYMPESMNMAEAKQAMDSGKVGVFCDGAHSEVKSKVNAVVKALGKGRRHQLIDAHFMSNRATASQLKDKEVFSGDNDVIFYNSAAKCGLSIKDSDYATVSLLASMTVNPNELIQASARFRMASTVLLSFDRKTRFRDPTNDYGVASKIMLSEMNPNEITAKTLGEMLKDEHKKNVISRIAYKNQMREDYINNTLIMLEEMGYKIEYIERDAEKESKGRSVRKKGNDAERSMRVHNVITAPIIDSKEAMQLRDNGEHNSQESKNMLENYNLRHAFGVTKVTEEIMEFDDEGKGRAVIENMKIARGEILNKSGTEFHIKVAMFQKFFELTGLCPNNFGSYSAINADEFHKFLTDGEIKINDSISMPAKRAFEIAFKDCNICHKSPMKTISGILKTVFRLEKSKNLGVRIRKNYVYRSEPNQTNEKFYAQAVK